LDWRAKSKWPSTIPKTPSRQECKRRERDLEDKGRAEECGLSVFGIPS
jgi:hypothetical protein